MNRIGKWILPAALALPVTIVFWDQVVLGIQLMFGGAVLAFLVDPIAQKLSERMQRKTAVLISVVLVLGFVTLTATMILPPMINQLMEIIGSVAGLSYWAKQIGGLLSARAQAMGFSAVDWTQMDFSAVMPSVNTLLSDAANFAGSLFGVIGRASMAVMLGIYYLLDKDNILLTLELMVPSNARGLALRMAGEAGYALRAYLRGQFTVSVIVGMTAFVGLMFTGVRSPLALGAIVGVLNMIPYFGPIIGGVPVVLTALTQDIFKVLTTMSVLFIVQQIDEIGRAYSSH